MQWKGLPTLSSDYVNKVYNVCRHINNATLCIHHKTVVPNCWAFILINIVASFKYKMLVPNIVQREALGFVYSLVLICQIIDISFEEQNGKIVPLIDATQVVANVIEFKVL